MIKSEQVIYEDRHSVKDFFLVWNDTSQVGSIEYKKAHLISLSEEEVSLILPFGTCSVGHNVSVYVFINEKRVKSLKKFPEIRALSQDFKISGNVVEAGIYGTDLLRVRIKPFKNSKAQVDQYIERLLKPQDKVNKIFEMVKGQEEFLKTCGVELETLDFSEFCEDTEGED